MEVVVFITFVDLAWSDVHGVCYLKFLCEFFAFAELECVRGVVCASGCARCCVRLRFANLRPTIGVGLPGLPGHLAMLACSNVNLKPENYGKVKTSYSLQTFEAIPIS